MSSTKQHAARLLARTEDDGGCLIWRGALAGGVYPSAKVNGKATLVRRLLWAELKGPIQPGHVVHCRCNTPRCVNPDHLAVASHQAFCAMVAKAGAMGGITRSAAIARARRAGPGAKLTQAMIKTWAPEPAAPLTLATAPPCHQTIVPTRTSPAIPHDTGARLTLGQINERLAPVSISVAGLSELGFDPVEQVKASRLYLESDLPAICQAIIRHVLAAAQLVPA